MSVNARLTVSTNCPNCGAPVDFGEGTNALQCDHCRSQLLVTGHGRVLSYFVSPKVERALAASIARFAEPEAAGPVRIGDVRLFFLPYYRITATELRWQRPEPERREEPPNPSEFTPDDLRIAALVARLAEKDLVEEIECRERAIERNFLAVELQRPALYSLGMRPSALRLELYRKDALSTFGDAVSVDMPPETALDIGRKSGEVFAVAYRTVVGTVLSVVYYPFWFIEIRRPQSRSLTIVDGVSQTVVERAVGMEALERLGLPASGEPTVIGFRPLVCPNCGWHLALEPDHVIHYCGTCARAWRIVGDDLIEMPHRVAEAPPPVDDVAEHLPFWALSAEIGDDGLRSFLVPAFRHRRAKSLVDLTVSLSQAASRLVSASAPPRRARGGYFDENDAALLALFAHAGAPPRSFARAESCHGESARVEASELVWVPFRADAYSLRDPFHGTSIARKLVL